MPLSLAVIVFKTDRIFTKVFAGFVKATPMKSSVPSTKLNIAMKLFVAGLPYDLYDDELVEIFEKFGTIASAKVALDKETGKSRGFAFVDMPNDEEAREAMEHLNDISLGKKPLVIKEADERSSGGGGYGGGSQGNRGGGGGYGNNRNSPYNNNRNKPRNRF